MEADGDSVAGTPAAPPLPVSASPAAASTADGPATSATGATARANGTPAAANAAAADSRRAAIWLATTFVGAVGLAVGNDLTTIFAHSPTYLFIILAVVAVTIGVLYVYGTRHTAAPGQAANVAVADTPAASAGSRELAAPAAASSLDEPAPPAPSTSPGVTPSPPEPSPAPDTVPQAQTSQRMLSSAGGARLADAALSSGTPRGGPAPDRGAKPTRHLPWWLVVLVAAAAIGATFAVGYELIGRLFTHGKVPGFFGLAGVAGFLALVMLATRFPRIPAWLSWLRLWRNTMFAVGLAALGFSSGTTLGYVQNLPLAAAAAPCQPPTELRLLASTEIIGPLQDAISAFERSEPSVLHSSCYSIDITVYPATAGNDHGADAEISAGWDTSADGPRPDVWIPASTEEVDQAKSAATRGEQFHSLGSVASSPLVVAAPSDVVAQLPATVAGGVPLGSIDQDAANEGVSLVLPNPDRSEAGRLGLADLTDSLASTPLPNLGGSASTQTDGGTLLCQAPHPQSSAYLVPDADVLASNAGQLGASGCSQSPAGYLTPFTPTGASLLDFPFTAVTWGSAPVPGALASDEQDFYLWLTNPREGGAVLGQQNLGPPSGGRLPTDKEVNHAMQSFHNTQPHADILIAIDDSGPMQVEPQAPYVNQIKQAVDGVLGPSGQGGDLSSRDDFGVWEFPGKAGEYQALVPLAANTSPQRGSVPAGLGKITAHGHSAEFDLVAAAVSPPAQVNGGTPTSLVLLTDGDDIPADAAHNNIGTVTRLLKDHSSFRVYVIAFGSLGCKETPTNQASSLNALAAAGGGTCEDAATGAAALQQQLATVVSKLSTGE